jgi:hypothetical protein
MGVTSTNEDIEKRRDDAKFCDHEPAADLKALLVAAADPRKFERRSAPAPKLKKSKKQLAAEKKYRDRDYRRDVATASEAELRAEVTRLKAENDELRTLLKMRIDTLEAHARRK